MSTPGALSDASNENFSLNYSAFRKQASEGVFLSLPDDPDEASFRNTAASINSRSHSPVEHDGSQVSPSPMSLRQISNLTGEVEWPTHDSGSPQSPGASITAALEEFLEPLQYNDDNVNDDGKNDQQNTTYLSKPTSGAIQLLSPGLTNDPSSPSDFEDNSAPHRIVELQKKVLKYRHAKTDSGYSHTVPELHIAPYSPNMNAVPSGDAPPGPSPVLKVSTYTRGDSPERDVSARHASRSSSLSPHGQGRHSNFDDQSRLTIDSPSLRANDGSWIPDSTTGQAGIDPHSRDDVQIQSPNQLEEQRKLAQKNADIQTWSASVLAAHTRRPRARSAGDPSYRRDYFDIVPGELQFDDSHIPGPGTLINEPSDEESEIENEMESIGSRPASPAVSLVSERWTQPTENRISPEEPSQPEPGPHQFFRPYPWRDPHRYPAIVELKIQPESSSDAIVKFWKRAKDLETASRVATWGTRRLSDSEVRSIIAPDGSFSKLSISGDKGEKAERRNSLFKQLLPRKSDNALKRKMADARQRKPESIYVDRDNKGHEQKSSFPKAKPPPQRKLSVGRSKSPSLNTGSAFIAMAGQMAAVGGRGSIHTGSSSSALGSWGPTFSRNRSKSDVSKSTNTGLMGLITTHGGPPVANITSPSLTAPGHDAVPESAYDGIVDGEEMGKDEQALSQKGQTMDFSVHSQLPIPTLDGFRTAIKILNPRIPSFLLERLAREQVIRYKSLKEIKAKHALAVKQNNCRTGKHCFALGGQATLLSPKASGRDPDATCAQYQIPGNETSDDESNMVPEGVVAAAQFPSGVPLPPVKRLPAEFECTLCFEVKKMLKPSDWTKHVHEDISPFTCTFERCSQNKSFKRKADWVRHENELHRKLEWWVCSFPDCQHQCFRQHNFVQHLIREHRMPDPKGKKPNVKDTESKYNSDWHGTEHGVGGQQSSERFWRLVNSCHHETQRTPQSEPCRFCGNVCSTWKKLTVHLAKHLEQIAMPVLQIVKDIEISPDTTMTATGPGNQGPQPLNTELPMRSNVITAPPSPFSATVKVEQDVTAEPTPIPSCQEGLTVSPVSGYISRSLAHNHMGNHIPPRSPGFSTNPSLYLDVPNSMTGNSSFAAGQPEYIRPRGDSVTYPPISRPQSFSEQDRYPGALSYPPTNPMIQLDVPVYDPQRPLCASPTDNLYAYPAGLSMLYPGGAAGRAESERTTFNPEDSGITGTIYMQEPESDYRSFQY